MARDGMLPARAAAVNAGGTPTAATVVTTAVAIVLIASGTFQRLIAVASFFLAVNYFVCCLALIALRRREPDAVRPFRAWGYPWSAAVVTPDGRMARYQSYFSTTYDLIDRPD